MDYDAKLGLKNNLFLSFNRGCGRKLFGNSLYDLHFQFLRHTGQLDSFAARKEWWVRHAKRALRHGHIDPLLFAMMTSALTTKHKDSGFDRGEYLRRVIRLYNAGNLMEILKDESRDKNAEKLSPIYRQKGLEAVKIECLVQDVVIGTRGKFTEAEMYELMNMYQPSGHPTHERREERNPDGRVREKTYSAIPKKFFLPLVTKLFGDAKITEEQVAILCCINFHSRERRKKKGERYVDHPMGVAGLVLQYADFLGLKGRELDVALMGALDHDTGEKSNFSIESELIRIVSEDVWKDVSALHRGPEVSFLRQYIGEKCASSRRTAAVKLCDSYYNSSDADPDNPSLKQAYLYPIALNFLRYRIKNRNDYMTISEFVEKQGICSANDISFLDNALELGYTVSEAAAKIPYLKNIVLPEDILKPDAIPTELKYDHLYGKDNSSLHNRPDVQSGYRHREVS